MESNYTSYTALGAKFAEVQKDNKLFGNLYDTENTIAPNPVTPVPNKPVIKLKFNKLKQAELLLNKLGQDMQGWSPSGRVGSPQILSMTSNPGPVKPKSVVQPSQWVARNLPTNKGMTYKQYLNTNPTNKLNPQEFNKFHSSLGGAKTAQFIDPRKMQHNTNTGYSTFQRGTGLTPAPKPVRTPGGYQQMFSGDKAVLPNNLAQQAQKLQSVYPNYNSYPTPQERTDSYNYGRMVNKYGPNVVDLKPSAIPASIYSKLYMPGQALRREYR